MVFVFSDFFNVVGLKKLIPDVVCLGSKDPSGLEALQVGPSVVLLDPGFPTALDVARSCLVEGHSLLLLSDSPTTGNVPELCNLGGIVIPSRLSPSTLALIRHLCSLHQRLPARTSANAGLSWPRILNLQGSMQDVLQSVVKALWCISGALYCQTAEGFKLMASHHMNPPNVLDSHLISWLSNRGIVVTPETVGHVGDAEAKATCLGFFAHTSTAVLLALRKESLRGVLLLGPHYDGSSWSWESLASLHELGDCLVRWLDAENQCLSLRSQTALLTSLLETFPARLIVTDKGGSVVWHNDGEQQLIVNASLVSDLRTLLPALRPQQCSLEIKGVQWLVDVFPKVWGDQVLFYCVRAGSVWDEADARNKLTSVKLAMELAMETASTELRNQATEHFSALEKLLSGREGVCSQRDRLVALISRELKSDIGS